MTCIVGIVDPKGIGHIASDSAGSNYHTTNAYTNRKIFRKADLLIGYTSSYRMGQLLEHQLDVPQRKVGQSLDAWLYIDFVNAVRKLLKDNGYMRVDSNNESIGTFMIITEGRLFVMQDDLAVLESKEQFDSVGSGANHATAALYTLMHHSSLTPRKMLTEAVNVAARYVTTVGGDVDYLKAKQGDHYER